jgi:hypothetical protein
MMMMMMMFRQGYRESFGAQTMIIVRPKGGPGVLRVPCSKTFELYVEY